MRPSRKENDKRLALFREMLENLLNREHEPYRLAGRINWELFEQEFGKFYTPNVGRPGTPIRLLVGLSCLGHVYGLSDEEVVAGWVENPYWQYFCVKPTFSTNCP
jgi:IS5 family transposase